MTAFSGLPDLLQDTGDLDKILVAVKQHVDPNFHPKIRQAAFYAIGKLCEETEEDYDSWTDSRHRKLGKVLMRGMSDASASVKLVVLQSLQKFLGCVHSDLSAEYSGNFLQSVCALVTPAESPYVVN